MNLVRGQFLCLTPCNRLPCQPLQLRYLAVLCSPYLFCLCITWSFLRVQIFKDVAGPKLMWAKIETDRRMPSLYTGMLTRQCSPAAFWTEMSTSSAMLPPVDADSAISSAQWLSSQARRTYPCVQSTGSENICFTAAMRTACSLQLGSRTC